MFKFNPLLACDAYKLSHRKMYPEGTELVYSNLTPRNDKYLAVPNNWKSGTAVVAGITGLVKEMVDTFNEELFSQDLDKFLAEYKEDVAPFCGLTPEEVEVDHLIDLHKLGFLPLRIKALNEGTQCPMQVPMLTIHSTHGKKFAWLTNYLETWLSTEGWKPCTTATLAYAMRCVLMHYAKETGGDLGFIDFQGHDFSMRGMSGLHDAARSGMGHLLSFKGSDTVPAAKYLKEYYRGAETFIACSVPASEHSVATMGGVEGEFDILDRILFDVHPTGIVSVVADSYDFFKVVTEYAASRKEKILNRKVNSLGMAKSVFRPDSGDPVEILCGIECTDYLKAETEDQAAVYEMERLVELEVERAGHGKCGRSQVSSIFRVKGKPYECVIDISWDRHDKQFYYLYGSKVVSCKEIELTPEQKGAVECLWEVFGGTETKYGYKVLHERVGLIYGDSITIARAEEICKRLRDKGFASTNCVYGIGSYTYQYNSRDSLGIAMKATFGIVNGEDREIFKQPKTDPGKNSAKGLLSVHLNNSWDLELRDQQTWAQEESGLLNLMFEDGEFNEEWLEENTLVNIRNRLWPESAKV